jgi:hypothetical protein
MTMPGFTAERSLYRTYGRYRRGRAFNGSPSSHQVVPQI